MTYIKDIKGRGELWKHKSGKKPGYIMSVVANVNYVLGKNESPTLLWHHKRCWPNFMSKWQL